ncbi:suppressor of hpr1 [Blastocladiella emersonii ATCC 22665]|nr:suppressor of hpr1 [Blastocladiella emersonii ATCC 22665]
MPTETPEEARVRCETELEFVQCLANPDYLHFLAKSGYFARPEFVNYLQYLQYWKRPEYAKLILYPQCLYFLDQLQDAGFRNALYQKEAIDFIRHRQLSHWYTYRNQNLIWLASFVREIADVQSSRPPYRVEVSLYSNGKLVSRDAAKFWGPRWAGVSSTDNLAWTPNHVRASAGLVLSEPPSLDASSAAMVMATVVNSSPAMAETDPSSVASASDAVPVAMDDMQRMTRLQRRSVADIKKAVASVQRTSSFLVAQRRASQSETAATMA